MLSPDLFVGRETLLGHVAHLLRQGRSTVLVGGRRAGKTTLSRRLSEPLVSRRLVYTDVAGWNLTTEASALGALLAAVQGHPETTYEAATRDDLLRAMECTAPVALVIDEADRLLQAGWGPAFYAFLRWLDDTRLRRDISLLLVGGPVLILFRDPDDRGSPPLNTAEVRYLDALDDAAVADLADLAGCPAVREVVELAGGQAWLTTRLLAEIWDGGSIDDAADAVFDRAVPTFQVWQQQVGAAGMGLLSSFPPDGLSRADARHPPWTRHRHAVRLARCVGLLRQDGERLCRGPRLFFDWLSAQSAENLTWDLAISYASEDEPVARQLNAQLRAEFRVFFAPDVSADLWGGNLYRLLPNTYGMQSRLVLVLSTRQYVAKHWTRVEYDEVARRHPDRILLLDMGELPADLPPGLVYRGSSPGEMVGLVAALRRKLRPD